MRKTLICLLLAFMLLIPCAFASEGEIDVTMEGEPYHLTLNSISIEEGKLTVVMEGFGATLKMGADGPKLAGIPEAHYGDEIVSFKTLNANVGGPFTFIFERSDLPDEIWINSYDGASELLWSAPPKAGSPSVPAELVAGWRSGDIEYELAAKNGGFSMTGNFTQEADFSFGTDGAFSSSFSLTWLSEMGILPFSAPQLDLDGFTAFETDGDRVTLLPEGPVFTFSYDEDRQALTLVWTGVVNVPDRTSPAVPGQRSTTIPGGDCDITLRMTLLRAGEASEGTIPQNLVGTWHGTGTPKYSGQSIDLSVTIEADGSGEYTFIQGDYTEKYPFTVSAADNTFSVDIPKDNYLNIVDCSGTWALEGDILKLDITTTFASGSAYSYTAECVRE